MNSAGLFQSHGREITVPDDGRLMAKVWATGLGTMLDKRGSQSSTGKRTPKYCGGLYQVWEMKRKQRSEP